MKTITLTEKQFQEIRALQAKHRADWPAAFGANRDGEIWMWTHHGNTPEPERIYVQGQNKTIDEVAAEYMQVRFDLGRFFIREDGAFCWPEGQPLRQFIEFRICG